MFPLEFSHNVSGLYYICPMDTNKIFSITTIQEIRNQAESNLNVFLAEKEKIEKQIELLNSKIRGIDEIILQLNASPGLAIPLTATIPAETFDETIGLPEKVLSVLEKAEKPLSPADIGVRLGIKPNDRGSLRSTINYLKKNDKVNFTKGKGNSFLYTIK